MEPDYTCPGDSCKHRLPVVIMAQTTNHIVYAAALVVVAAFLLACIW